MTKTERLRRLRVLAAESRRAARLKASVRVEVGSRLAPVRITDHVPTSAEAFPLGDDLDSFWTMPEAAAVEEVSGEGVLVHLYLSTTGPWGELQSVTVGWIGTKDQEPVLINVDGREVV